MELQNLEIRILEDLYDCWNIAMMRLSKKTLYIFHESPELFLQLVKP